MTTEGLGSVGDRLLLENDRVRVWEVDLESGASQPLHRHELPYLVIPLEWGTTDILDDAGNVLRRINQRPGTVTFREPGETHTLLNRGPARYRNLVIELR